MVSGRPFAARLPLSRAAVDRDHRTRLDDLEGLLTDPSARVVVLHEGKALLAGPDRLALIPVTGVPAATLTVYLGRSITDAPDLPAGSPVLAFTVADPADMEGEWGDLLRIGARLDERDAGLFTQALAIVNWHTAYGFSPRAGRATEPAAAGWVRRDPETGQEFYPRTDAAIIVGVTDADDRLLLGSNVMWEPNRYSLLAGFVEPGESLEAAVAREVFEESGVRVTDVEYLGSQPWPFPASLMVGFRARVSPGTATDLQPDGEEIRDLRWFSREELAEAAASGAVLLPGSTSIARAIVEEWFGGELVDGPRSS